MYYHYKGNIIIWQNMNVTVYVLNKDKFYTEMVEFQFISH